MAAEHTPHISDTAIYWVNFLLYLTALYFLVRKPFVLFWTARRESLLNAVHGSRDLLRKSEEKLRVVTLEYANIEDKKRELLVAITKETERECEEILTEARHESTRVEQRSRETISRELKAAQSNLQKRLIDMAFHRAEEKIRSNFSEDLDQKLRQSGISNFSQLIQ